MKHSKKFFEIFNKKITEKKPMFFNVKKPLQKPIQKPLQKPMFFQK